MFGRPDYSTVSEFLDPRLTPYSVDFFLHKRPILEAVKRSVASLKGTLLDIGCGIKPYKRLLECDSHIGIDVPATVNRATTIDCFYDGSALPFRNGTFDSVLCTEVLEHCRDPRAFMREVSRVMKADGHVLVTVPFVIHHHEEPFDFTRFTRYGLIEIVEQAGLHPVWVRPRGAEYATALAAIYLAISYTVSRRPIIDIILWALWPVSAIVLKLDGWRHKQPSISLGWQMLARKRAGASDGYCCLADN